MENVSLTISKDIVNPIVEAKIKEAVLSALGGKEELVANVVDQIINKKVNEQGNVSSYKSDNKSTWLDVIVTKQIKEAVKEELISQIAESSKQIKEALISQLRTKRGSSLVAKALLDGLGGTFKNSWRSNIKISIDPYSPE